MSERAFKISTNGVYCLSRFTSRTISRRYEQLFRIHRALLNIIEGDGQAENETSPCPAPIEQHSPVVEASFAPPGLSHNYFKARRKRPRNLNLEKPSSFKGALARLRSVCSVSGFDCYSQEIRLTGYP